MSDPEFDLIIIGAGWHGLTLLKTYTTLNPTHTTLLIDSALSLGGVWARERQYPGLKTNNLVGSYELSDVPMGVEEFGVKEGMHIPGAVVGRYLEGVGRSCGLGVGIEDRDGEADEGRRVRTWLGWRVEGTEMGEGSDGMGWSVEVRRVGGDEKGERRRVKARRLAVATGLTSEPFVPEFKGRDGFGRVMFHARELRERAKELEGTKEVVVLGGNKSAWDTCFWAATEVGAQVHMVMRPEGGGPSWLWPVFFSPLQVSVQRLATTRFFTWFDPCIWAEQTGVVGFMRRMLHGTRVGRWVVNRFWSMLEGYAADVHRYDDHPETRKLRPWVSPFWMGNSLSIHNYTSSWLDQVRRGNIKIHISDIDHLSDGTVHLSNGVDLKADAMVCCTGWDVKPPLRLLPEGILSDLGFGPDRAEDDALVQRARSEIYARVPALRQPPRRVLPVQVKEKITNFGDSKQKTPDRYQLYRFLVPANETLLKHRNIAFIGSHLALSATMVAQLQALWITAYFMDEIPHLKSDRLDINEVKYQTVLHNEYTRIRHPKEAGGSGERCPDLAFDCLAYIDLLESDLGLRKYRKGNVLAEVFQRYVPADFKNLAQEWTSRRR